MPRICYVKKDFSAGSLATIKRANEILNEYARQGYDLTLRQLYYQFVSRGIIANNNPPPNPAKITDSRANSYIAEYGDESWELDALEPSVLTRLIQDTVAELRDDDLWNEALEAEDHAREWLNALAVRED
jgi:hypothetical protein